MREESVLCPFYVNSYAKRVRCEWLNGSGTYIMQEFDSVDAAEDYKNKHCRRYDNSSCPFYQSIMDSYRKGDKSKNEK